MVPSDDVRAPTFSADIIIYW